MYNEHLYGRVVNWDDIPGNVVRPGVTQRAYSSDQVMVVHNTVEKGLQVRPHSHDDFDQLVYIVSGVCDYNVAGTPHRMSAGDLTLVPAGAEHYIDVIEGPCHNIDIFVPPRTDYAHLLAWVGAGQH